MSHRRALLVSLVLTVLAGVGIVVARDALSTNNATSDEPLITVQTLELVSSPDDPAAVANTIPGEWPSTERHADEREPDELWERILSGSRHERDDDHEGEWDHDD